MTDSSYNFGSSPLLNSAGSSSGNVNILKNFRLPPLKENPFSPDLGIGNNMNNFVMIPTLAHTYPDMFDTQNQNTPSNSGRGNMQLNLIIIIYN
jgi:hypothetical protein